VLVIGLTLGLPVGEMLPEKAATLKMTSPKMPSSEAGEEPHPQYE